MSSSQFYHLTLWHPSLVVQPWPILIIRKTQLLVGSVSHLIPRTTRYFAVGANTKGLASQWSPIPIGAGSVAMVHGSPFMGVPSICSRARGSSSLCTCIPNSVTNTGLMRLQLQPVSTAAHTQILLPHKGFKVARCIKKQSSNDFHPLWCIIIWTCLCAPFAASFTCFPIPRIQWSSWPALNWRAVSLGHWRTQLKMTPVVFLSFTLVDQCPKTDFHGDTRECWGHPPLLGTSLQNDPGSCSKGSGLGKSAAPSQVRWPAGLGLLFSHTVLSSFGQTAGFGRSSSPVRPNF